MTTKHYRVTLYGRNFLIKNERGLEERKAFQAECFIEASDEKTAADEALKSVREDKKLISKTLNAKADPPIIFIERTEALAETVDFKNTNIKFEFFTEEEGQLFPELILDQDDEQP